MSACVRRATTSCRHPAVNRFTIHFISPSPQPLVKRILKSAPPARPPTLPSYSELSWSQHVASSSCSEQGRLGDDSFHGVPSARPCYAPQTVPDGKQPATRAVLDLNRHAKLRGIQKL